MGRRVVLLSLATAVVVSLAITEILYVHLGRQRTFYSTVAQLPSILIGVIAVALLAPARSPALGRGRGALLLAVYAASIVVAALTWKAGH